MGTVELTLPEGGRSPEGLRVRAVLRSPPHGMYLRGGATCITWEIPGVGKGERGGSRAPHCVGVPPAWVLTRRGGSHDRRRPNPNALVKCKYHWYEYMLYVLRACVARTLADRRCGSSRFPPVSS